MSITIFNTETDDLDVKRIKIVIEATGKTLQEVQDVILFQVNQFIFNEKGFITDNNTDLPLDEESIPPVEWDKDVTPPNDLAIYQKFMNESIGEHYEEGLMRTCPDCGGDLIPESTHCKNDDCPNCITYHPNPFNPT